MKKQEAHHHHREFKSGHIIQAAWRSPKLREIKSGRRIPASLKSQSKETSKLATQPLPYEVLQTREHSRWRHLFCRLTATPNMHVACSWLLKSCHIEAHIMGNIETRLVKVENMKGHNWHVAKSLPYTDTASWYFSTPNL